MGRSSSRARCIWSAPFEGCSSTIRRCVTRSRRASASPSARRPPRPCRFGRQSAAMTPSTDTPRGESVVPARPELGGGAATPSLRLPTGAGPGLPGAPEPLAIGARSFDWGRRTYVMGILNVTPDSFSGDGLLAANPDPVSAAVDAARAMVEEGADLLDIGGESTRPGHSPVSSSEEIERTAPVIAAIRAALPTTPLAVDTTKAAVAEAALDAGADLINDVWGVRAEDGVLSLAASRRVPIVLMHNREEPRYLNLMAEVIADLQARDRPSRGARSRLGFDRRRPGIRVRQDRRAQHRPAPGSGGAPDPRPPGSPRGLAKVDPRQDPGPARRPACRGNDRHHRHRHRRGRRHRPRPRCPGERARRTCHGHDPPFDDRPHRPPQHPGRGPPRRVGRRAGQQRSRSRSTSSCVET